MTCPKESVGMTFHEQGYLEEKYDEEMVPYICFRCEKVVSVPAYSGDCCSYCTTCDDCLKKESLPEYCTFSKRPINWMLMPRKLPSLQGTTFQRIVFHCELCGTTGKLALAKNHFRTCDYKKLLCEIFSKKVVSRIIEKWKKNLGTQEEVQQPQEEDKAGLGSTRNIKDSYNPRQQVAKITSGIQLYLNKKVKYLDEETAHVLCRQCGMFLGGHLKSNICGYEIGCCDICCICCECHGKGLLPKKCKFKGITIDQNNLPHLAPVPKRTLETIYFHCELCGEWKQFIDARHHMAICKYKDYLEEFLKGRVITRVDKAVIKTLYNSHCTPVEESSKVVPDRHQVPVEVSKRGLLANSSTTLISKNMYIYT